MSQEEMSEDERLAAEWAASLEAEAENNKELDEENFGENAPADDDAKLAEEWAAALATDEQEQSKKKNRQLAAEVSEPSYKNLTDVAKITPQDNQKRELDFILDIPLDVSAELGKTRLLIKDLLQLGQGSVIELNKLAGEPLEIFVNGKLVARGEAVVVKRKIRRPPYRYHQSNRTNNTAKLKFFMKEILVISFFFRLKKHHEINKHIFPFLLPHFHNQSFRTRLFRRPRSCSK